MTLYRPFASKDELVAKTCVSPRTAPMRRRARHRVGRDGLGPRLMRMGEALIAAHAAKP